MLREVLLANVTLYYYIDSPENDDINSNNHGRLFVHFR